MILAIVGSRTFTDFERMSSVLWDLFRVRRGTKPKDTIVSGGANGADTLAKQYAQEEETLYLEFPADWKTHGKAAGFIRNQDIVDACDVVLAFWDGKSKGTKDTIDRAARAKKPTFIVYF